MPLSLAFAGRTTESTHSYNFFGTHTGMHKPAAAPELTVMTLKSEVAELHYEVAELSSGELRLTFTTGYFPMLSSV